LHYIKSGEPMLDPCEHQRHLDLDLDLRNFRITLK